MEKNKPYFPPGENLRCVKVTEDQERDLFKAAKAGDEKAREFLILNHRLFALKIARRIARNILPDEEVGSSAMAALMRSIDSFDPSFGIRYCTFLRKFLHGEVMRLFKSNPKPESEYQPARCYEPSYGGDESTIAEDLKSNREKLIEKAMTFLKPEEQRVLQHVYWNQESLTDLAAEKGHTRAAASLQHRKALAKLKRILRTKFAAQLVDENLGT